MSNITMVRTIHTECPACKARFRDMGYIEPHIKSISEGASARNKLPTVLGFKFACPRCYYQWVETQQGKVTDK